MGDFMIGKTISHYRILEKLGKGGMGEVYKAEDTKLKRTVALKFLPAAFSFDEETKKRFVYEAQSASALDHPNICTIYEIGETEDSQSFIAMAYYEGETLKSKIEKGAITPDKAVKIFLQIAEGLSKAHNKGIIHRDIKPANIFINEEGIVKILDFGLAKSSGRTQLTQMGSTVGTISYMSPEQARGEEVDQRTDIWALGVVIYEMLIGTLPFNADYDQAVIYSILNEEPDLNKVPSELQSILQKTITKSPNDRYQKIDELISDIEAKQNKKTGREHLSFAEATTRKISLKTKIIAASILMVVLGLVVVYYLGLVNSTNETISITSQKKMIVVLPFVNLGSPEDEYFAQGMREEISNKLAELGSIGVISRSSAEKFAKSKKTAKEIGKELGVDYILEGTVQWEKNKDKISRIRIIPQLVRVSDDENIWSDSYDKVINDVFKVQNEIAQNVVDKLGIKILPRQFASESPPTKNLDAYEYYLKATRTEFADIGVSSSRFLKAINLYKTAIDLDSNFAAAHALLATMYLTSYNYIKKDPAILEKISSHLQKARELNPELAEVHLAQGGYYYFLQPNGLQKALVEFKKVLEIRPNNAEANFMIGITNYLLSKYDLELPFVLKAFSLDPFNIRYAVWVGNFFNYQRDYKNAEKFFKRAIELASNESEKPYLNIANNYIDWKGNTKLARQTIKNNNNYGKWWYLIYLDIIDRNFNEALKQLKSSKKEYRNSYYDFIPNSQMIALIYKYLKNDKLSRIYFDSSKIELEKKFSVNHDDIRLPLSLSITYAGLGEKTKALAAFNKALKLAPKNVEILPKVTQVSYLARIYTLVGDYDNALMQINYLLSNYTGFSINRLKLDPIYDPLRKLPGYETIIEKYSKD